MLQLWHERALQERLSEQEKYREGFRNINFSRMCCVVSTSDDGKILYGESKIGFKGGKQLTDVWIVDLRATWHMTLHRDWFYTNEPVLEGSVLMRNDHALEIDRVGTIKIENV